MAKFWGSYEVLNRREAIITLHCAVTGEWSGSSRIQVRKGLSLYDSAYLAASTSAALKGGSLERFSEEA